MKSLIISFVAVFLFIGAVGYYGQKNSESGNALGGLLKESPKTILVAGNPVEVQVVKTDISRAKGLGGKDTLLPGKGMLFVFDKKDVSPPFWMKDMNFAIDIIWINDGKVAQITKDIPPPTEGSSNENLKLHLPDNPIDYVLEVSAGYSDEIGIKVGDTVDLSEAL